MHSRSSRKNSSNGFVVAIIAIIVVLVLIIGLVWLLNKSKQTPSGTTGTGTVPAGEVGKPKPIAQVFNGCPPSGDGGDPALNTLKNRIDEAPWQPSTVATILSYTWPQSIERQPRARWSQPEAEAIASYEGAPVQVEGYLVDAKSQGPESCNCHSVSDVDFHIWLVDSPDKKRDQSVVVEASPRVRAVHPAWTISNIRKLVTGYQRVRISGWLMMDPEHPDQIGKTRGTIWEIHPIMQIETQSLGGWMPLDNGTTGVKSAAAASEATLPLVTPESTASPPPAGSANLQRNQDVQIININFDGKTKSESDEYVEITNQGSASVDITDWELQDPSGNNEYKWESYVIQPGTTIRVYTNEVHNDSGGFSFGSKSAIWNNSGDLAELYDADQALVSRYAYGSKR